jgi:chlorobactene lauroyltransferase
MIEARKNQLFESLFGLYNTHLLRRHFHRLLLDGREEVNKLTRSLPIIFFGNHSCWWDGLIQFYLSRSEFDFDSYLMMDEQQMIRYTFFRRIGVFSVDRASPREAMRSVNYAVSLLDRPNRVLWIYPQAIMRPNDTRPLRFYSGLARIAQALEKVQLVPIALRYEFLREQRPDALVRIGAPIIVEGVRDQKHLSDQLESCLTELLDSLRCSVVSEELDQFEVLLSGKRSTNVVYDTFRQMRERA